MDQRAHPSGVIPCNFPTSRESCFHPNRIHSQWPGSLSLLRRAGARAHVCDRIGSAARLAGLLERLTSPSLLRIAVLRAIECWSVVGRHEGPGAKIRTHCLSWSPFVARTLPLMDRQPRRSSFAPAVDIGPLLIGLGARCRSRRLRGCAVSLFRPIVSGVGVRNTEKFPCSVMYGICSLSH